MYAMDYKLQLMFFPKETLEISLYKT